MHKGTKKNIVKTEVLGYTIVILIHIHFGSIKEKSNRFDETMYFS